MNCKRCAAAFIARTDSQEYCGIECFTAHRVRVPAPKALNIRGKRYSFLIAQYRAAAKRRSLATCSAPTFRA